jgi:hypothetical protein
MNADRLEILLHRHFDQLLTLAERQELSMLLLSSPKAREEFWRMARWHALIRQWGESEWGRLEAQSPILRALPPPSRRPKKRTSTENRWIPDFSQIPDYLKPSRWTAPLAAAAAVFLGLFLLARFAQIHDSNPQLAQTAGMPVELAVLSKSCDAVWADAGSVRTQGQSLHAGPVRLTQGAVQIDFARGARVVLEGPADFELLSDNEGKLHSGRLRAYVPEPAHGFLVRTRDFHVVDLGTEFGCEVPQKGASELHVFEGKVSFELPSQPESGRHISENEALSVTQGIARDIKVRPSGFLDESELSAREKKAAVMRREGWKKLTQTLSRDPSVLVHLDFEAPNPWSRSLSNRAHQNLADGTASIVGCEWVPGRWPQKGALEFTKPGDRVRLAVPGLFDSLTLLAWIQVSPGEESARCLLSTESDQPGEIRWILQGDGSLTFSLRTSSAEDSGWRSVSSSAVPALRTPGRWHLVSTVYNGANGTVSHFLNGTLLLQSNLPSDSPVRLDTFEIGNAGLRPDDNLQASATPVVQKPRVFNGRMDTFLIFSAPLHSEEIQRVFELGTPSDIPRIQARPEPR